MNISVIVPVFNEQANIRPLFDRLKSSLEKLDKTFEIIFVNDGSTDTSPSILKDIQSKFDFVKIINFTKNFGQHAAIIAGFANACGELQITIDADLQNPPEEISRIVDAFNQGFDVIGTIRQNRNDSPFRKYSSKILNKLRKKITKIPITDQGCMLRGYKKNIAQEMVSKSTASTFIPILAYTLAKNPTEIDVAHAARNAGKSKYNVFSLAKLGVNTFRKNDSNNAKNRKLTFEIKEKIGF